MKQNQWYYSKYIAIHSGVNWNETNRSVKMENMEKKKLEVVNDT